MSEAFRFAYARQRRRARDAHFLGGVSRGALTVGGNLALALALERFAHRLVSGEKLWPDPAPAAAATSAGKRPADFRAPQQVTA